MGEKGQSLVEVLIAIVVVTLVLITIVTAVILALKSTQFSRHKTRGTLLAQEVVEWVRGQRQSLGWGTFVDQAGSYCLVALTFTNPGSCNDFETIDQIYKRELELDYNVGQQRVEAEVVVRWFEGDKEFNALVSAQFYDFEYAD